MPSHTRAFTLIELLVVIAVIAVIALLIAILLPALGGHGYALDPPRLTDTSDYADTKFPGPQHRAGPHARHLRRVNASFCDGHVATLSIEALGYLKNNDGSIAANGPGTTNAMFPGDGTDKDPPNAN